LGRAFVIQSGVNRAASPPFIQTTTPKDVGGWLRFASQPRQKLGVLQGFIASGKLQRQNNHMGGKRIIPEEAIAVPDLLMVFLMLS